MDSSLALPASAPRMAPLGCVPVAAVAQLVLMGGLAWAWLVIAGVARGPFEAALCTAPALLAVALSFTSQADRQQYVVRLLACAAMLPILLMMWAGTQDPAANTGAAAVDLLVRRPWLFFSAFALLHAALFVGAVFWLAAAVTRVDAAPGVAPVSAATLAQRLRSLTAAGVPLDVVLGERGGEWVAHLRLPAGDERSHRVILRVDEATRTVQVRERLGARAAAPNSADEASLRSIGDPAFDPTRPDAQRISSCIAQTSMIDPAQLAATRLGLAGNRALPAPEALSAAATDTDAIVALLCALVTRSGYAWQPLIGLRRSQ
jgi:hypothetical protein